MPNCELGVFRVSHPALPAQNLSESPLRGGFSRAMVKRSGWGWTGVVNRRGRGFRCIHTGPNSSHVWLGDVVFAGNPFRLVYRCFKGNQKEAALLDHFGRSAYFDTYLLQIQRLAQYEDGTCAFLCLDTKQACTRDRQVLITMVDISEGSHSSGGAYMAYNEFGNKFTCTPVKRHRETYSTGQGQESEELSKCLVGVPKLQSRGILLVFLQTPKIIRTGILGLSHACPLQRKVCGLELWSSRAPTSPGRGKGSTS